MWHDEYGTGVASESLDTEETEYCNEQVVVIEA